MKKYIKYIVPFMLIVLLCFQLVAIQAKNAEAQVAGSQVGGLNLWKLVSGNIVPVLPSYNVKASTVSATSTTGTSLFAGNVTINGQTTIASTSNIYSRWVRPILWTGGSASQTSTSKQWQCEQFEVPVQKSINQIVYSVGTGQLGANVAGYVYKMATTDDMFLDSTLVLNTGSIALTATTSTITTETLNLATSTLAAGGYWACLQWDNSNASFARQSNGALFSNEGMEPNTDLMFSYSTTSFATAYSKGFAPTADTRNAQPTLMIRMSL